LNFTAIKALGVAGVVTSWVHTSDENGALQFLPNDAPAGNGTLYDVPALFVGNSTGETIRGLLREGKVESATVVLDAPSLWAPTNTVIGHLDGNAGKNDTILIYTHSGTLPHRKSCATYMCLQVTDRASSKRMVRASFFLCKAD
jgi:hypothetical protein